MSKSGSFKYPELTYRFQFAVPIVQDLNSTAHSSPDRTQYLTRPFYPDTGEITGNLMGLGRDFRWLGSHHMPYTQYIDSLSAPLSRLKGGMRGTLGHHVDDDMSEGEYDAKYIGKFFGRNVDIVTIEGGQQEVFKDGQNTESFENSGAEEHPDLARTPDPIPSDYRDSGSAYSNINIVGNGNSFNYGDDRFGRSGNFGDAPYGNYALKYEYGANTLPESRVNILDWPGTRNNSNGASTTLPVESIVDDVVTLTVPYKSLNLNPKFMDLDDNVKVEVISGNSNVNEGYYWARANASGGYVDLENQPIAAVPAEKNAYEDFINDKGEVESRYVGRVPNPSRTNFLFSEDRPHGVKNNEIIRILVDGVKVTSGSNDNFEKYPLALHQWPCTAHQSPLSSITIQKFDEDGSRTFKIDGVGTADDVTGIRITVQPGVNALATKNYMWKSGYRTSQGVFSNHALKTLSAAGGRGCGFAKNANLYLCYSAGNQGLRSVREWHKNKPINPETGEKNPTIAITEYGSLRDALRRFIPLDSIESFVHRGATITKPSGGWGTDLRVFTDIGLIPFRIEDPENPGTWMWTIPMGEGIENTKLKNLIESMWDEGIIMVMTATNGCNTYVKRDDPEYYGTTINVTSGEKYYYARDFWETVKQGGQAIHSFSVETAVDEGQGTQSFNPFVTHGPIGCSRDKSIDVAAGQNSETFPALDHYTNRGPGIDIVGAGHKTLVAQGKNATEFKADTYTGSGNYLDPSHSYWTNSDTLKYALPYPFKPGETVRIHELGETNSYGHNVQTQWNNYLGTTSQTYAPGDEIVLPNPINNGSIPNNSKINPKGWSYTNYSGSSCAGPSVVGKLACIIEQYRHYNGNWPSPNQAKDALLSQAKDSIKGYDSFDWSNTPSANTLGFSLINNGVTRADKTNLITNPRFITSYDDSLNNGRGWTSVANRASLNSNDWSAVDQATIEARYSWEIAGGSSGFTLGNAFNSVQQVNINDQSTEDVGDDRYSTTNIWSVNSLNPTIGYRASSGTAVPDTLASVMNNEPGSVGISRHKTKVGSELISESYSPQDMVPYEGSHGLGFQRVGWKWTDINGNSIGNSGFGTIANDTFIDGSGRSRTINDLWWTQGAADPLAGSGNGFDSRKNGILCFSLEGSFVPNNDETFGTLHLGTAPQRVYSRRDAHYSPSENGNTVWWWNIAHSLEQLPTTPGAEQEWRLKASGIPDPVLRIKNTVGGTASGATTSFNVESGKSYVFIVENPTNPIKLQLGSSAGANDYFDVTGYRNTWTSTVTGTVHLTIRLVSTAINDYVDIFGVHARQTTKSELVTAAPFTPGPNGDWPSNDGYETPSGLHRNYVSNLNGFLRKTELCGTPPLRAFVEEGNGFYYNRQSGVSVIDPNISTSVYPAHYALGTNESTSEQPDTTVDFTSFDEYNSPIDYNPNDEAEM